MDFQSIQIPFEEALELDAFKRIETLAVENYKLPIRLMMENAGLHLARIVALNASKEDNIVFGIGTGNNGGGGLVAARRLLAWGYQIFLNIPEKISNKLPQKQMEKAFAFGANLSLPIRTNVFVDAFFGSAQNPPLPEIYLDIIRKANKTENCTRISLDIPSGITGSLEEEYFDADIVCCLGAAKKILYNEKLKHKVLIADIGLPREIFSKLGLQNNIPFEKAPVFQLNN